METSLTPDQQRLLGLIVLGIVACILAIDLVLIAAWLVGERRRTVSAEGSSRPLFAPRWSLVDVWAAGQAVAALTLGSFIVIGAVLLVGHALHARGAARMQLTDATMAPVIVLSLYAQNAFLIAVPALIIWQKYATPLPCIGWRLLPTRRDFRLGVPLGILAMLVGGVGERGMDWLITHAASPGLRASLQHWTSAFSAESMVQPVAESVGLAVAFGVAVALLAPLGEEAFFRALLYNSAKQRFGVWWGIAISGGVFALVHGGPLLVPVIFPMGVLLAYSYERTRSLWVPILMHATNNGVQIVVALATAHAHH